MEKRPDSADGGLRLPLTESGLIRFPPPRKNSDCAAVTVRDAQDDSISDPQMIVIRLRANWGYASATQLKRVLVASDGGMSHLVRETSEGDL